MSAGPATAPRATLDLKVKVWGMGSNDRPFFQNAVAQNISATGACIFGIEQQLKVGDVIGVQYEARKARCKVIWVVDAGGIKKTQVGVQLVADQECPWLAVLPKEALDNAPAVRAPDNRRKFLRHKISFPLQLRDERVNTPMRANSNTMNEDVQKKNPLLPRRRRAGIEAGRIASLWRPRWLTCRSQASFRPSGAG